jgi:tetratricopeptide (TPR) repeat protein
MGKRQDLTLNFLNFLLKYWRTLEPRCGVTHAYAGRLALIHILMKDFGAARTVLAKAPSGSSPYAYSVDAARAQVQVQERLADDKPITAKDLGQFEALYAGLVSKYPKWPSGYGLLGGVQILLGKHADAIKNLKIAAQGDVYELFGVYRNLTISYSATGAFNAALEAADKAYELNRGLTSDASYMYSAALANSALGKVDEAETLLKLILAKRPEVRSDPEFIRAVEFYREQRALQKK